jgi:N-terminal domain of oxidoreductase
LNSQPNHKIVLAERPSGTLGLHHFKSVTTEVPPLAHDQVLIRVIFSQVAPAARAVMTITTPFPPTNPGDGILTAVVGEVLDGPPDGPAPGTIVTGYAGWEQYSVVPVSQVRPVQIEGPLVHHLSSPADQRDDRRRQQPPTPQRSRRPAPAQRGRARPERTGRVLRSGGRLRTILAARTLRQTLVDID